MKLRLSDIAAWVDGRIVGNGSFVASVSTDTRTIGPGSLFVALRGERYDAHDFVATARERGATAALVEHVVGRFDHGTTQAAAEAALAADAVVVIEVGWLLVLAVEVVPVLHPVFDDVD